MTEERTGLDRGNWRRATGDHVLELQIAEVVDETDEARSLVFAVPDGSDDPEIPLGACVTPPANS